ncbi:MAG: hypothetical protein LBS19_09800 [Clostridiales bacterium]|jgi:hypothetical protein|nr:hypothetical protein [Clostridiales bacterium]
MLKIGICHPERSRQYKIDESLIAKDRKEQIKEEKEEPRAQIKRILSHFDVFIRYLGSCLWFLYGNIEILTPKDSAPKFLINIFQKTLDNSDKTS